jgi:hypothetical protein
MKKLLSKLVRLSKISVFLIAAVSMASCYNPFKKDNNITTIVSKNYTLNPNKNVALFIIDGLHFNMYKKFKDQNLSKLSFQSFQIPTHESYGGRYSMYFANSEKKGSSTIDLINNSKNSRPAYMYAE